MRGMRGLVVHVKFFWFTCYVDGGTTECFGYESGLTADVCEPGRIFVRMADLGLCVARMGLGWEELPFLPTVCSIVVLWRCLSCSFSLY
jgi:hypothetical protein